MKQNLKHKGKDKRLQISSIYLQFGLPDTVLTFFTQQRIYTRSIASHHLITSPSFFFPPSPATTAAAVHLSTSIPCDGNDKAEMERYIKNTLMYTFSRTEEGQEGQLAALVAISALAGVLVLCFNYTVELLIALLVVEHPGAELPTSSPPSSSSAPPIPPRSRSRRSRQNSEAGGYEETQPLMARGEKVFVTDSIVGTIRHLRRIGGRAAPWRGFIGAAALAFFDRMVRNFVISKLQYWTGSDVAGRVLGGTLSLIAVSRLSLTVVQFVPLPPSPPSTQ